MLNTTAEDGFCLGESEIFQYLKFGANIFYVKIFWYILFKIKKYDIVYKNFNPKESSLKLFKWPYLFSPFYLFYFELYSIYKIKVTLIYGITPTTFWCNVFLNVIRFDVQIFGFAVHIWNAIYMVLLFSILFNVFVGFWYQCDDDLIKQSETFNSFFWKSFASFLLSVPSTFRTIYYWPHLDWMFLCGKDLITNSGSLKDYLDFLFLFHQFSDWTFLLIFFHFISKFIGIK